MWVYDLVNMFMDGYKTNTEAALDILTQLQGDITRLNAEEGADLLQLNKTLQKSLKTAKDKYLQQISDITKTFFVSMQLPGKRSPYETSYA